MNINVTRHKADRTYQYSPRLSTTIHYASINNKYMSESIEKNILPLISGLPRIAYCLLLLNGQPFTQALIFAPLPWFSRDASKHFWADQGQEEILACKSRPS